MKIFKKLGILSLVALVVVSCDFGDTNIDPTSVSAEQVTLPLILPKAEVQSVYNIGSVSGRMAGIWMQYFEGVEAQQSAITNYSVQESDFSNPWEFQLYVGSMRDNITILDKALEPGNRSPYYAGIARVLLAQNLGFATQGWGDIPWSEAFQGSDNLNPAYDSQEAIFGTIQTLLDSAIANFGEPASGVIPGADDLIYGGDVDLWTQTARALKARYYIMLSKRNGNAAYTDALAQINAGTYTSVEDESDFDFEETANFANPISLFEQDRASTLQFDPTFAGTILNGDPRADAYFVADGLNLFADDDLYWGRNESPLPIISYSEMKFLESEALLMTGDIAGAEEALVEAVKSNMHQVELDSSDAAVATYIGSNTDLDGLADQNARLDRIISEKYKAMYVQGMMESWSDYRRTGFPSFIAPEPGAALSVIPRRFFYPQTERLTNSAAIEAATANQGGASLTDDMWAFQ